MAFKNILNIARAMTGSGGIDGFRDRAEAELMKLTNLIPPGEHAVVRLNTTPPDGGVNKMVGTMPLGKKIKLIPVLLGAMNSVTQCADYMKDKLVPTQEHADNAFFEQIKALAQDQGALDIAYIRINEHEIFTQYAIPYRNALVFTMPMDKKEIDKAPSFDTLIEVLSTYEYLGKVAIILTKFLRDQGYGAYPGFPIGGMIDYVRVAEQAGLGAIGYHGLLISPEDGTRQRINNVYTNMELEFAPENDHLWIRDFCSMCNKCVRECPPSAIYTDGEVNPITGRKPTIDYDTCIDYFANNTGCAVCVKVCPFSQAGYDVIQTRFIGTRDS